MESLRSRAARAVLWNVSGTGGRIATQLLIQVCLARLLAPEDFGLMAMLMVVTSVGMVFVEGGFGLALIHRKDSTREEESSVLFVNLLLALIATVIVWLGAPWVAAFYGHPILAPLLRFCSLVLVVGAFGVVQNALLSRSLSFKILTIANLASSGVAGGIAILLAWNGIGIWSLAWQFVLAAALKTAILWLMSSWRPVLSFQLAAIRTMGVYGSSLVASQLIAAVFENLHQLLIGKFYTAADLGFYSRGKAMEALPVGAFSSAVGTVLLPAFVNLNTDPAAFRNGMRRAVRCMMAVAAPMMILLAVLAEPLFAVLLSTKWLPAVPYFQWFCASGLLYPIHLLNLNSLLALGRPKLYLKTEIIKRVIALAGAAAALPFGVLAFSQTAVVVSFFSLMVNTFYTSRLVSYEMLRQLLDCTPFLISAAAAGAAAWAILRLPDIGSTAQLVVGASTGAAIYFVISWILGRDTYHYIAQSFRNR